MYRRPRPFRENQETHKATDSEAPGFTIVPWVAIKMICFKRKQSAVNEQLKDKIVNTVHSEKWALITWENNPSKNVCFNEARRDTMHTEDGCDRWLQWDAFFQSEFAHTVFQGAKFKAFAPQSCCWSQDSSEILLNLTVWALLTSLVKPPPVSQTKPSPQTFLSPALSPRFHLLLIFQKEEATAPASADT